MSLTPVLSVHLRCADDPWSPPRSRSPFSQGRGQETPGEDPYLTSEYAYLFVTGFQGGEKGAHGGYLKASSCCKHYAVYNLEGGKNGIPGRNSFNAVVDDPRDFEDTYFPAFQSCAQRAGASGGMCSCEY